MRYQIFGGGNGTELISYKDGGKIVIEVKTDDFQLKLAIPNKDDKGDNKNG